MTAPIADTHSAGGQSAADYRHEYGGTLTGGSSGGWVVFAGTLIALAGCMNVIHGIAAIGNSRVLPDHAEVVVSNLKTWGWVMLILGVGLILTAVGIWAGNQLARWVGVAVLFVNALAQLTFASEYPIWSLTIFGLDVLAIYALMVHGGRAVQPE
jgi:hypothetical protein